MPSPLSTAAIEEIATSRPDVVAFRIRGHISGPEFMSLGERMNEVFDAHDTVSLLLLMQDYEDKETGAGWDWETLRSNLRSIAKLDKYVVVGAPDRAARMIEGFGKVLPLTAETYPAEKEAEAWAAVGATPLA